MASNQTIFLSSSSPCPLLFLIVTTIIMAIRILPSASYEGLFLYINHRRLFLPLLTSPNSQISQNSLLEKWKGKKHSAHPMKRQTWKRDHFQEVTRLSEARKENFLWLRAKRVPFTSPPRSPASLHPAIQTHIYIPRKTRLLCPVFFNGELML